MADRVVVFSLPSGVQVAAPEAIAKKLGYRPASTEKSTKKSGK